MKYTVVGIYDDNGQRYCEHFDVETPEAAEQAAIDAVTAECGDILNVAGVFEGKLMALL